MTREDQACHLGVGIGGGGGSGNGGGSEDVRSNGRGTRNRRPRVVKFPPGTVAE